MDECSLVERWVDARSRGKPLEEELHRQLCQGLTGVMADVESYGGAASVSEVKGESAVGESGMREFRCNLLQNAQREKWAEPGT